MLDRENFQKLDNEASTLKHVWLSISAQESKQFAKVIQNILRARGLAKILETVAFSHLAELSAANVFIGQ